jgi:hypothetical protein
MLHAQLDVVGARDDEAIVTMLIPGRCFEKPFLFAPIHNRMVTNYRPWTHMFTGAGACAVICLGLVYLVTVTGDTSYEIIIYVLVLLEFILVAGGYFLEEKYRKEYPSKFVPELPDS